MTEAPDLDHVRDYYVERILRHGAGPAGVDWGDEAAQDSRLAPLAAFVMAADAASVCDVGCGYGALLDMLRAEGFAGSYAGVDIAAEMIDVARERCAADDAATFDVGRWAVKCDLVVASGIFNVRLAASDSGWRRIVDKTLQQFAEVARMGIAVNFLPPPTVPVERTDLHFEDPARVTALLSGLGFADVRVERNPHVFDMAILATRGDE